ncbi:helix-turn-helix domain-containing protein [Flavobacterium lindanitolerans]|uniref:helix-turn-helix domain-containing protein n=1 Tax=Flavobacterium lindanitolerans TaxID=428988 RepID=UPI0023F0E754|nr:AraC family transcriptional regulator [Flavobacterium lindanitolerans]
MNGTPQHRLAKPDSSISDFVYCFSSIRDLSEMSEGVIIPNGKIDLSFYKTSDGQFYISLLGLETKAKIAPKLNISVFFSINFNPLAVEYILGQPVADILDSGKIMPDGFWDFHIDDLNDFDAFCEKATGKIQSLMCKKTDERKRRLFDIIFKTYGEISIKELSDKIGWKARQINQYFNLQFGISLKAYCSILRFQASLSHIKEGKLFPQLNYYDQSHFIKEIKKLSGASPKELFKNENRRFLQFLVKDME